MTIDYYLYPRILTEEELELISKALTITWVKNAVDNKTWMQMQRLEEKLQSNCVCQNLSTYIKESFRRLHKQEDEMIKAYQEENGIIGSTDEEVKAVFDWLFDKIEKA